MKKWAPLIAMLLLLLYVGSVAAQRTPLSVLGFEFERAPDTNLRK